MTSFDHRINRAVAVQRIAGLVAARINTLCDSQIVASSLRVMCMLNYLYVCKKILVRDNVLFKKTNNEKKTKKTHPKYISLAIKHDIHPQSVEGKLRSKISDTIPLANFIALRFIFEHTGAG